MTPEKLFDYLEGKLPEQERWAVEEELMNNEAARREFDVARRIHSATQGRRERLEIIDQDAVESARGSRMARKVLLAALVLVALNVAIGLMYIAHRESHNPNRAMLEKQTRDQLRAVLDKASQSLTPPPLGVTEFKINAASGQTATLAKEIVQLARRLGGTATEGIPNDGHLEILVELAGGEVAGFHNALGNLAAIKNIVTQPPASAGELPQGRVSIVVQISEAK